jgi:hypothetical protein
LVQLLNDRHVISSLCRVGSDQQTDSSAPGDAERA